MPENVFLRCAHFRMTHEGEMKEYSFINKIKDAKPRDFLAAFGFLAAIVPSIAYKAYLKMTDQRLWLVCEEEMEAQDTGWSFFRHMRDCHPEIRTVYAISRRSPAFEKVLKAGEVVSYSSLKHWIYYLAAEVNISSQKGGKPNAAVCYFLEVYGLLRNRRVFLQHGIIMNNNNYLHYENSKMWLFVTSNSEERDYVERVFNYPKGVVVCTGLSRFDYLVDESPTKTVLLIPSWRSWLKLPSKVDSDVSEEYHDFMTSEYYGAFQGLINDDRLIRLLEEKDYTLLFYPHRNVQPHLTEFSSKSDRVILASDAAYDIQQLLRSCDVMVTDYSSVSFDFAYLRKPIIYYQFDEERFRKYQYAEGYFSYRDDGFGPVVSNADAVIHAIDDAIEGVNLEKYRKRERSFFTYHDKRNGERIYQAICEKLKKETHTLSKA